MSDTQDITTEDGFSHRAEGLTRVEVTQSGGARAVCVGCGEELNIVGATFDVEDLYDTEVLIDGFVESHASCPPQSPCPVEEAGQVTPPVGPATPLAGSAGVGDSDQADAAQDVPKLLDQFVDALPTPAEVAGTAEPRQGWVVKLASGGDLHIWAQWHSTFQRAEGVELRFYNESPVGNQRVATVRPGSWHWVAATTALEEGKS